MARMSMEEQVATLDEKWRCPNCNKLVEARPMDSPYCPNCHENLRKCRYCKWADTGMWECTNFTIITLRGDEFGRFRIPEPEYAWRCPVYTSTLTPKFPLTTFHLASIGLVLLILVGTLYSIYIRPHIKPKRTQVLWVLTDVPQQVRSGTPYYIRVNIRNLDPQPSGDVMVRVQGTLIENSEQLAIYPQPQRTSKVPRGALYFFPPIPGGYWQRMEMVLRTRITGEYDVRIVVYQNGEESPGKKDFKVRVVP